MSIKTFKSGAIYYENFREHYYMLGEKKVGAQTMIKIMGCRSNPQDFRKERFEKTEDCRSVREQKGWLKLHYSESAEYIKASRRGNAFNYIHASDTIWDTDDNIVEEDAENSDDDDEEPLRAPLATPVNISTTVEVKKMIKEATEEIKEVYIGTVDRLKSEYEKEREALKIKHEEEKLDLHNEFYAEKRRADEAEEELRKARLIIQAQDMVLAEEMVRRLAIRTKEFEGCGLCFFSRKSKEWLHYTDYEGGD